jgi:capsular polysaccharide transport system permease protein
MTPPPEDSPKRLRAVARGPAPDPAPDPAPWPAEAGPGPADGPDPEAPAEERKERRRRRRRRRRGRGGAAEAVAAPAPLPARARPRHWGALAGFLALVLLPFAAATGYLFLRAAPQYHSEVAFSVRSEEATSATAGLLGALTQVGGGTAPDAAILYEYIRSQEIVAAVDARLDLRAIWNRPGGGWRDGDPVFTLGDDRAIEALHRQWLRMVTVSYDTAAGIIDVVARAFAPEEAHAIAEAILAESSALVNELAEQAREDAVRFAREELAEAEANLAEVRARLAGFRREHSLVDPSADVAGQSGLLNALNAELAQALVDRDVLTSYAGEGDQRVLQADRRIAAITERIEDERATLGVTGVAGTLPEVVGRFEELSLDLEFANTAYTQALAGLAAARAEARRQSRYLAPHVRPTLATTALYPRRFLLAGLAGLFLLLGWGTLMLVYYNVRDNR